MIKRPYWLNKFQEAWQTRPLIWLSGVRRTGKTTLAKMLPHATYLNCELPSVARQLEDIEFFYHNQKPGSIIVFDEIHKLNDPSSILKIGTDEFPRLKILATGSSTLSATKKFRDSLTGRKTQLFLPPVLWNEYLQDFKQNNLDERLYKGGLPEFLLAGNKNPSHFSEWIESYYAREIQELFNIRNRNGFLNLMNLLFMQSGGVLEVTKLSKESGLSRPTVMSHIEALSLAHAINLVYPFYGGGKKEIVKRPKVYAFDTGFVTFIKGWNEIRENDRGILWEHLALDMLKVRFGNVHYWQEKNIFEIDFVIKSPGNQVNAFECKVNPDKFSPKSLALFREYYPEGKNYCLSPHIKTPYKLKYNQLEVEFISSLKDLPE